MRNNNLPISTFHVTDLVENKLSEMIDNGHILDYFDLAISPCSTMALTGFYNGFAHVVDMQKRVNTTIKAMLLDQRGKTIGIQRNYKGKRLASNLESQIQHRLYNRLTDNPSMDLLEEICELDYSNIIQSTAWHPKENTFAVANNKNIFIYTQKRNKKINSEVIHISN